MQQTAQRRKHTHRVFGVNMTLLKCRRANIWLCSTIVMHVGRCTRLVMIFDNTRCASGIADGHNTA